MKKDLLEIGAAIQQRSRKIDIINPVTQEKTGIVVTLLPLSDPQVKAVKRRHENSVLSIRQRNKHVNAEMLETNAVELLAVAVAGWDWSGSDLAYNGVQPEYSPENVKTLLRDPNMFWFRNQIDEELADDTAFFQK